MPWELKLEGGLTTVKYFVVQSWGQFQPFQIHLLTQSDRSRQWVACRKALLDHFVQTPLVDGVSEELNELRAKGRQIVRLSARQELLIELYLLVHPRAPGVFDVGLQARPGGDRPPANGISFDQQPGSVTDRGHGLVELHERPHETHGLLVRA